MATMNDLMNNLDSFCVSVPVTCEPEKCSTYIVKPNLYLKILQQNVRSINQNFCSLQILLTRIKIDCDIVVLSESWINDHSNIPNLDGYYYFKSTNYHNKSDGIVIYVKRQLNAIIEEPMITDANCLVLKISTDTVVIAIYRPPCFRIIDPFLNSLQSLLDGLSNYKNIILVGDININILTSNTDSTTYLDMMSFHGLLPAITRSTRGKSCLDHVIVKTKLPGYTFVLETSLTDHDAVLYCLKTKNTVNKNSQQLRHIYNHEGIKNACEKIDFGDICTEDNLNMAMNI
jgi:hypothetical protein